MDCNNHVLILLQNSKDCTKIWKSCIFFLKINITVNKILNLITLNLTSILQITNLMSTWL